MAMYYFARKIQKARRPKSPPQQQQSSESVSNARIPNGCIGNNSSENKAVAMVTAQISSSSTSSSSNVENQQQLPSSSGLHFSSSETDLDLEEGLRTGSMETLIRHLVPTENHYPDRAFTFAFLLASRLHVTPQEVLGKVLALAFTTSPSNSTPEHCSTPYGAEPSRGSLASEIHTIANVIHLLGEWTELFPYDFRDERMMVHVRAITERSVQFDSEPVREEVSHLLTTLLARLTGLERHEYLIHRLATEKALASPLTPPSILTICPNPAVLAQQLTHLELGRIAFIGPQEFVQDFLKESTTPPIAAPPPNEPTAFILDSNNQNPKSSRDSNGPKKTRNLLSYLYWHTRLRFFVATEICRIPKTKGRAALIEYWIETARECFNIGNFNSLMAIIMAFNMSPLERLKKTSFLRWCHVVPLVDNVVIMNLLLQWNKVDKAQLYFLHHQMNPAGNYANYRFILQKGPEPCLPPGATSEGTQRVFIPFMSLLVKDLCFLSQECRAKLANAQINFAKFWQLAKQVREFMAWQQVHCSFPKVQPVMNGLQMPAVLMERGLFLASYSCENPVNANEEEHFQSLQDSATEEVLSNGSTSASENPHSSTTSTSTK